MTVQLSLAPASTVIPEGSRTARATQVADWAPSAVAAALAALVVALAWHGSDLPAQVYRMGLFRRYGFLTFDTHWYGGH